MKNYQIGIIFTTIGSVYLIISFLLIPFVLKPVAEGWGPFPVLILSFWIFVLQSLVLTILGIFNIITNKIIMKNLLKISRIFGYISFFGIFVFMIPYAFLILIPSSLFMMILGIIKDEDFLD